MPEIVTLGKMKQLAGQFTKGLVGGAQFRQTLYHSHSADEILDNITIYFETLDASPKPLATVSSRRPDRDLVIDSCVQEIKAVPAAGPETNFSATAAQS